MDDALKHAFNLICDGATDGEINSWLARSDARRLRQIADLYERSNSASVGWPWRPRAARLLRLAADRSADPHPLPAPPPRSSPPFAGPPSGLFTFPIFGLAPKWPGARWLDWVDVADRPLSLVLGHDDGQGRALLITSHAKPDLRLTAESPEQHVAHRAVVPILQSPRRLYGDQAHRFSRALVETATKGANDTAGWPTLDWSLDGQPLTVRYWTLAGRWAAYAVLPDSDLTAHGYGEPPVSLPAERLLGTRSYGFDREQPVSLLDRDQSPPIASHLLPPSDPHPDHAAVLQRAGITSIDREPRG